MAEDVYFRLLAKKQVRDILQELVVSEKNVGQIVVKTGFKQPVVSMILAELKKVKLVSVRSSARERIYCLNGEILNLVLKKIMGELSVFRVEFDNEFIVRR